jgi:hypothetical protein
VLGFFRNDPLIERWKNLATIAAILIGGAWALKSFIQQRQGNPRLQIEQRIVHFKVSDKYNLLVVDTVLKNVGPVLLKLPKGEIRVIPILPLPGEEQKLMMRLSQSHSEADDPAIWPVLNPALTLDWGKDGMVIEPGESDQLHSLFPVPADKQVVAVATYVFNPNGRPEDLWWHAFNTYDFGHDIDPRKINRGTDGGR